MSTLLTRRQRKFLENQTIRSEIGYRGWGTDVGSSNSESSDENPADLTYIRIAAQANLVGISPEEEDRLSKSEEE